MRYALLLAPLLLAALAGCGPDCVDMPAALIGRWTSDDALYAERHMTIEAGTVEFGTGGGQATLHGVVCVERRAPDPRGFEPYRIVYLSEEGEEYVLPLLYDPAGAVLRLTNRDQVAWMKAGTLDGP